MTTDVIETMRRIPSFTQLRFALQSARRIQVPRAPRGSSEEDVRAGLFSNYELVQRSFVLPSPMTTLEFGRELILLAEDFDSVGLHAERYFVYIQREPPRGAKKDTPPLYLFCSGTVKELDFIPALEGSISFADCWIFGGSKDCYGHPHSQRRQLEVAVLLEVPIMLMIGRSVESVLQHGKRQLQ